MGDIYKEETLFYHINFQNTGTDTAFNIVLRDTLDTDLDILTFVPGSGSHSYTYFIDDARELTFTFADILLPDSNVNEPGSHGFVEYAIRPKTSVSNGTLIKNTTGIYFDFNPPVITNTVTNRIGTTTIHGMVYGDLNTNGVQNQNESGKENWIVVLRNSITNNVITSVTTNQSGSYTFANLEKGNYKVELTSQSGYIPTENAQGKTISVTEVIDTTVKFGVYFNNTMFRTFKDAATLSTPKAVKMKIKSGVVTGTPNEATALNSLFSGSIKTAKGATFLGLRQTDPTVMKTHGWIFYKTAADIGKMFTSEHTGSAYPIDSLRADNKKAKSLGKAIKADRKKYNNTFWAQGILLHLNLFASQDGVTPLNFGALEIDTAFTLAGRELNGMSLVNVAKLADTLATNWSENNITGSDALANLQAFANLLKRINNGFYEQMATGNYTIDTANLQTGKKPYAVKLKGVKTASDVGIVRYVPNTKSEQLAFGTGEDGVPSVFTLEQNYPNPFNPTTAIRFEVGGLGLVSLKIYNVLGQEVATLIHSRLMEEGMHEIEFDASSLSSGVYFYRLTSSSETKTFIDVKKMMLMK